MIMTSATQWVHSLVSQNTTPVLVPGIGYALAFSHGAELSLC